MANIVMIAILTILTLAAIFLIWRLSIKFYYHYILRQRQKALGELNLNYSRFTLKLLPSTFMIILALLFFVNGREIATSIFPTPMGSCVCAPDDYNCMLNSGEDISIIHVDSYNTTIEYNPFDTSSYQFYDSVFFEFTTLESLYGETPNSNIIGQWVRVDRNSTTGCETNIVLEEGKTYLIIGNNLTVDEIQSFTNSSQHLQDNHYWVGFIIELEDYDSSKPLNQQSQEVQNTITEYISQIEE